jgi:predicted  nucleic acid-binding Zn-ribbon protein
MENRYSYYGNLEPIKGLKNTMAEHAVTEMVREIIEKETTKFQHDLKDTLLNIKKESSKAVSDLKKDILIVRQKLFTLDSKIGKTSSKVDETSSENYQEEMQKVKVKIKERGIRV